MRISDWSSDVCSSDLSLVMYLNTPERGGATTFPDVNFEVAAVKGNAVFFSYDRPHTMTRTLHGGAPVLAGEKWIATKWLRSEEHTSELQSLMRISYAVFCLKKKK